MQLCELKNRFLFEVRPDLFPPMLTQVETELWSMHYEEKQKERGKHG